MKEQRPLVSIESDTAGSLAWLIRVRWFGGGILILIAVLDAVMGEFHFPILQLLLLGTVWIGANFLSSYLLRRSEKKEHPHPPSFTRRFVGCQGMLDWLVLVSFIMLTGGFQSPLRFLLAFQVLLTGLFLKPVHVSLEALGAFFVMILLSILQGMELFPRFQEISYVDAALFVDIRYLLLRLSETAILLFVPALLVSLFSRRMLHLQAQQRELQIELQQRLAELSVKSNEETKGHRRILTHELRAPITASMSMIALLQGEFAGKVNAKQKEMLERAGRRLSGALEIIQDILTLEASHKAYENTDFENVELTSLFKVVLEEVSEQIKERQITLTYTPPPRGLCVNAVYEDLMRIFRNLIGNAIKYNKDGGTLTLVCRPVNTAVRIEVSDTGIGILPGETERVFQEFFRGTNARSLSNVGTGLGLCIAKSLVEKYGGHIEVQSEIHKGTTFAVTLPISPDSEQTIDECAVSERSSHREGTIPQS